MRLQVLQDTDSGKLLFAYRELKQFNDVGEDGADGLYFVRIEYTEYYDREWSRQGKYHVSVVCACPLAVQDKDGMCNCVGVTREDFEKLDEKHQAEIAIDYGCQATLWQQQGNNLKHLLRKARNELQVLQMLSGFRLDVPQNAFGNTGWDFVKGTVGFNAARHVT